MGKHFDIIMEEMCSRVGTHFKDINPKEDRWFEKHQWTEEDQESFKEWFVDYLLKSSEARKEILSINTRKKMLVEKAVRSFLFNYGWKFK